LENIQNTLEEVSDTLKTKLSPENMDPFKLEKDTYIRYYSIFYISIHNSLLTL
jgi:hypothetical protein